jgi:Zn-dependent protease with chaperone function
VLVPAGASGEAESSRLLPFLLRLVVAAAVAALAAWAVRSGVQQVWPAAGGERGADKGVALVLLLVTGGVDVAVYLLLARALRLREVTAVSSLVTGRLRR